MAFPTYGSATSSFNQPLVNSGNDTGTWDMFRNAMVDYHNALAPTAPALAYRAAAGAVMGMSTMGLRGIAAPF